MTAEGYNITKYLYNRTEDKAQALANEFDCHVITTLAAPTGLFPDLVISTLPPQAQTETFERKESVAQQFAWMFENCTLAMDLVYRPRETPMLKLAKKKGVRHLIEGIDILLEQVWGRKTVVVVVVVVVFPFPFSSPYGAIEVSSLTIVL
jgi:shikimate 5-dehydrogenase